MMTEQLRVRHERIDDIPLIIGTANKLELGKILNHSLGTHGLQQGLNNGQLAVGWIGYILSEADHRKAPVQEWAHERAACLGKLLGEPIREIEFSDDRLGGVLRRLSDDESWAAIEQALWKATVNVYDLGLSGARLDATSGAGYHVPEADGLMQQGHSKDQRPDLAQVKLMAAAAEPSGYLLASDVEPGNRADDPLYIPLIERVRRMVGRSGLLYAGDSKMAALGTRAYLAAGGDFYLVPLPRTGTTREAFDDWIEAIVAGPETATLVWDTQREQLIGAGYEWTRPQSATVDGETVTWDERVLLVRSAALVKRQTAGLEQRLQKATADLRTLTPDPGPGRRQIRSEAEVREAVEAILVQHRVTDFLNVVWEREETHQTRYRGPGRPGPNRETYTETTVRYVITAVQRNQAALAAHKQRLGWRLYATNTPPARLPFAPAVHHYRRSWIVERDIRLVKDRPLGLSPLFVWKDDQIKGLIRLLTLALRILTLIETQVRQGLAQDNQQLAALYPSQPSRTTARPTGQRLLRVFARANLTLSRLEMDSSVDWHLTPLSSVHQQILHYLRLPLSLYTDLAYY